MSIISHTPTLISHKFASLSLLHTCCNTREMVNMLDVIIKVGVCLLGILYLCFISLHFIL